MPDYIHYTTIHIMRHFLFLMISIAFFSCKNEEKKDNLYPESGEDAPVEGAMADMTPSERLGKEITEGKGNCFACHKPDQKIIGPSIMEIAKIYKEKNGNMAEFLKGKGEPIVDPLQYEVMKTNFAITKNFTDEELKAIEDYFYSTIK